jgi:hypothetical protein
MKLTMETWESPYERNNYEKRDGVCLRLLDSGGAGGAFPRWEASVQVGGMK